MWFYTGEERYKLSYLNQSMYSNKCAISIVVDGQMGTWDAVLQFEKWKGRGGGGVVMFVPPKFGPRDAIHGSAKLNCSHLINPIIFLFFSCVKSNFR